MAANVSEYINAGNIAARNSRNIQAAAIRSGSDLSKISKEAANQRVQSEIAARRAAAGVAQAGMQGKYRLKATEMALDEDKRKAEANKSVRKAGAVAAAGALIGEGLYKKPARPEREPVDYSALDKSLAARRQSAEQALASATSAEATFLAKNSQESPQSIAAATPSTPVSPAASANSPLDVNKRALLETISFAEGTWDPKAKKIGYNIAFGGGTFDNSLPHPDRVINSSRVNSAAHGAYQFMPGTWEDIHGGKNPVMTPENQDKAAIELAVRRGYDFNKPFGSQISVLAPEWASFPTAAGRSQYNLNDGTPQPTKRNTELTDFYNQRVKELLGQ